MSMCRSLLFLLGLRVLCQPTSGEPAAFPGLLPEVSFSIAIPINRSEGAPRFTPRQIAEMGAVALTGVGHLAFAANDAAAYFILLAIGSWSGSVGDRTATEPGFLREAGFTNENLGPAFRDASIFAGVATAGMAAIGAATGNPRLDADMLPLLVLYPAWH